VRHAALLPQVDLFVTHAGLSSVGAAMTTGVPMVCMPLFNEQPENAEHARRLGIANVVAADAPPGEIRTCLEAALADGAMRATVAKLAASIGTAPLALATREIAAVVPSA
jgi:UDP:flavonoid glycosyltransferase YjiC (YdhE family)